MAASRSMSAPAAGSTAGELALGYRDIIAISAGVNTFATDNGDTDAAANVGVRLGTTGILAALYGLAALGGR